MARTTDVSQQVGGFCSRPPLVTAGGLGADMANGIPVDGCILSGWGFQRGLWKLSRGIRAPIPVLSWWVSPHIRPFRVRSPSPVRFPHLLPR
jgi:hypothetical protein